MNLKVVTFGEIMLRLSPPNNQRFIQAKSFDVIYGGGEANVAVSLANFGLESVFVTKVPNNEIGQSAINSLRQYGVITDYILKGGSRLGLYYCENGAAQRASKVIYDRRQSSISEISIGEFNWKDILKGASWFHFTGITPALSDNAAEETLMAIKTARELGIRVSVDINYRSKLWTREKANSIMNKLMEFVNIIICNEEDAEKVFNIKAEHSCVLRGELYEEGYKQVAATLIEKFRCDLVAITLRESISASDNSWSGVLYDGTSFLSSKKYRIHIVDRIGGGDAFAAGLIYSLIKSKGLQETLEFAVSASCLKHTIYGDYNLASLSEIEDLAKGNASGRVQR